MRILLIGATSGVATECARRYAKRGDSLYLVGRTPAKLQALVDELGAAVAGHVAVDLTDTEGHTKLVTDAVSSLGGLDLALICHGLLPDQLKTEQSYQAALQTFSVNQLSVVSLLIPLANELERRQSGHLAVITSVAAERGRPRNFTYGAAKAALNTYLQGLRSRLYPAGVQVHTLKLGPTDTPMTQGHPRNVLFATAGRAADDIVAAIDGGTAEAWIPWYWGVIMPVVTRLPEPLFQRIRSLSGR